MAVFTIVSRLRRGKRETRPVQSHSSGPKDLISSDFAGGVNEEFVVRTLAVQERPTPQLPDKQIQVDAGQARFTHLDALRAFSVLVVVVGHAGLGNVVPGGSGVTIFFAISGFIITYLMLAERRKTAQFDVVGFYLRRLLKLGPPLLVAVAIPTVIYAFSEPLNGWSVLSQFTFGYNWFHIYGPDDVLPGTTVVWSLSIEEQFYIVFAALWVVACGSRHALRILGWAAVIAIVTSVALKVGYALSDSSFDAMAVGGSNPRVYFGTDTRLDTLAIGVGAAVLLDSWRTLPPGGTYLSRFVESGWAVPLAAVLYLATLVVRDPFIRETARYPLQGLAACIVILAGIRAQHEHWSIRWLNGVSKTGIVATLGLASYSIYLIHGSIQVALEGHVDTWPRPLSVAILVVLPVLAGIALYRLVEVPLEPVRERLRRRARARKSLAATTATPQAPTSLAVAVDDEVEELLETAVPGQRVDSLAAPGIVKRSERERSRSGPPEISPLWHRDHLTVDSDDGREFARHHRAPSG